MPPQVGFSSCILVNSRMNLPAGIQGFSSVLLSYLHSRRTHAESFCFQNPGLYASSLNGGIVVSSKLTKLTEDEDRERQNFQDHFPGCTGGMRV